MAEIKHSHERADEALANNVTYQRCLYAYDFATSYISGKKVVDVGCGLAYGTSLMASHAEHITGIDYDQETIAANKTRYKDIPNLHFLQSAVPPLALENNTVDVVTAFQFIEHIEKRNEFIKDVLRVLRPGGVLLITTPNVKKSFARNPFHVHEYTFEEMRAELKSTGAIFELKGLQGDEKVNQYYEENSKWVRRILKYDVFGLHKKLPAGLLTVPYNRITSFMRKNLMQKVDHTLDIDTKNFFIRENNLDETWDIYAIVHKP
jgi:2-polyprenyl-3-methyl-5-hydroxy-6-metoxy-1,4-benzoquinol methylase